MLCTAGYTRAADACVWQIAEEQAEVAQLKAQVAQLLAKRKSQAKA